MDRRTVLRASAALIDGPRAADYGPVEESFGRLAQIWSALLGVEVPVEKVAAMLIGLKLSRLAYQPTHEDSWLDVVGYAALGTEVATERKS